MPLPRSFSKAARASFSRGFTLVELLCVIAIIGILVSILIPVVGSVRQSARNTECLRNLSGIGTAFQLYAADNNGLYPALRTQKDERGLAGTNLSQDGWQAEISPYQSRSVDDLGKLKVGSDSYAFCPEYVAKYREEAKWTSTISTSAGYGMNPNLGVTGFKWSYRFRASQIPQPSRTILVGDSSTYSLDIGTSWKVSDSSFGGYSNGDPMRHGAKSNYLYADGHVASLSPEAALAAAVIVK